MRTPLEKEIFFVSSSSSTEGTWDAEGPGSVASELCESWLDWSVSSCVWTSSGSSSAVSSFFAALVDRFLCVDLTAFFRGMLKFA